MKTSYKLAFAVCALIFTGSVVYWASKKFGKQDDTAPMADAGAVASPTDLTSPTAPPPGTGAPVDSGVALTSAPPPAGPDAGAAAPTAPPPPVDVIAVAPPAAPAAPVAPPAPEVKPEVKPVAKTEVKAPTAPAAGKTYAVRSGDTLTSISQKFFGDKNHTDEIYKANRKTIGSNPNALKVGMKLAIPAK